MIHLPGNAKDQAFLGFFLIGGVWTIILECCIVMRYYHQEWNSAVTNHIIIVFFLACLIYSDMYFLISTDVSATEVSKPCEKCQAGSSYCDKWQTDWRYCDVCKSHVPPRSHHCQYCNICILKRDHHCIFAGYCVGHNNHRYFASLVLYICIAGIYANIYNWEFFITEKGGFTWSTMPALFVPHVGLLLGHYSLYEFALTVNTSVGFLFTCFFIWLFYTQVVHIVSGQVMYERKKGIKVYNAGTRSNIYQVFGSAGLLALLCPYLPTKLPSDGTSFPQQSCKSDKNK